MADASQSIAAEDDPPPKSPPRIPPDFGLLAATSSHPKPTMILDKPGFPLVKSIFCPFCKLIVANVNPPFFE